MGSGFSSANIWDIDDKQLQRVIKRTENVQHNASLHGETVEKVQRKIAKKLTSTAILAGKPISPEGINVQISNIDAIVLKDMTKQSEENANIGRG